MPNDPEIINYGRMYTGNYSEEEMIASIQCAFKFRRTDNIILDDSMREQKFLVASVSLVIDKGWLYNDRNDNDGQCKVSSFRLTETGKKELLG